MSTGTQTFTFKPALLKAKKSYFVGNDTIELANKDGIDTIIRLEDITRLRYADSTVRESQFRRLYICIGETEVIRIGITTGVDATAQKDKDLHTFYKLLLKITKNVNRIQPKLFVTLGETSRVNWVYFSIGALTVVGAGGIFIGAYLSGVSDQKMMNTLFPIIGMAGFGAYICFMARPWVKRTEFNLTKFRTVIEKLLEA